MHAVGIQAIVRPIQQMKILCHATILTYRMVVK